MTLRWTTLVAAALVSASAAPLHAQWLVEAAAGGVAHQTLGATPSASTSSLSLGVRREGRRWLYVAAGIPLDTEAVPWGALGAGGRELAPGSRRARVGLDWAGHGYGYTIPETGASGVGYSAHALPFVGAGFGMADVEVRSGVVRYATSSAGATVARTGHDSGITAALAPAPWLRLIGDGRVLRTQGIAYSYAGASAEIKLPGGTVWGYGGRWADDALPDAAWGAGAALDVGHGISIRAAVQQDATDPLYWNETRQFWSVGLSRRFGPAPSASLAVPVAPETAGGGIVFRIPASAAPTAPSVAGDFNEWTPSPMRRVGDEWVATLRIRPGVYHYAFRGADGEWFVPASVPNRVDDGFGGTNAVLVVPERSAR